MRDRDADDGSERSQSPSDTYQNEEWLREQYVEQEKTQQEIADDCGVSQCTIGNSLSRHGIETRGGSAFSPSKPPSAFSPSKPPGDTYRDREWLREQYVEKKKTSVEIADECGVSSTTIRKHLNRFEIERETPGKDTYRDEKWLRGQYVEKEKSSYEIADDCGVTASAIRKHLNRFGIETRGGSAFSPSKPPGDTYRDSEWLREQYVEKEKTQQEIGDECGVAASTIGKRLNESEIEMRSKSEARLTGESVNVAYQDEEWLREQYVEKKKSTYEIADDCGVSNTTIGYRLKKHGIEIRSGHRFVERLGHTVDSDWELDVGVLLHENGISYENEPMTVTYTTVMDFEGNSSKSHTYTPDFVTDDYVIEVKGRNWGAAYEDPGTAERKARAAMNYLGDREYVVVGIELPCDHHYSWDEREGLLELFE